MPRFVFRSIAVSMVGLGLAVGYSVYSGGGERVFQSLMAGKPVRFELPPLQALAVFRPTLSEKVPDRAVLERATASPEGPAIAGDTKDAAGRRYQSESTLIPLSERATLLVSDFSLAGEDYSGSDLTTTKLITVDGQPRGRLKLIIDSANRILVDPNSVAALGPEFARIAANSDDRMSFDTLRSMGLDVRYDAGNDRVVVSTSQH